MIEALAGDVAVAFADWGEPVLLRTVTREVDAGTGVVTESCVDMAATAIFSASARTATAEGARVHHRRDLSAVVRCEEVPAGFKAPLARVVRDGTVYEVAGSEVGADGVLVELTLRAM